MILQFERKINICSIFYLLHIYWQLKVESTQPKLNIAFQENISITKSQTGNILVTSGIWKVWNTIRCSTLNGNWLINYVYIAVFVRKKLLMLFSLKTDFSQIIKSNCGYVAPNKILQVSVIIQHFCFRA